MKDNLAIIPTRKGSKGIVGKNLRKLNGYPLFLHTVDFAIKNFEETLISTDDNLVIENLLSYLSLNFDWDAIEEDRVVRVTNRIYLHKRHPSDALEFSTIDKVLYKLADDELIKGLFRFFTLLQPTSPFRVPDDIDVLVDALNSVEWSSVVSVKSVGGNHPNRMFRKSEQNIGILYELNEFGDTVPRQLLSNLYIKDGAYYVLRTKNLEKQVFLGERPMLYVREILENINIDTELDFKMAEYLMKDFYRKYYS